MIKSKNWEPLPSSRSEMYVTISCSSIHSCRELKNSYFLIVLSETLISRGLGYNHFVYFFLSDVLSILAKITGCRFIFLTVTIILIHSCECRELLSTPKDPRRLWIAIGGTLECYHGRSQCKHIFVLRPQQSHADLGHGKGCGRGGNHDFPAASL